MASMQTLDVVARSATTTPSPSVRSSPQLAKLIDESKCIGCKACQVACMNWNDLRDEDVGQNIGVYDNPSDLTPSSWTVMRFFEVEPQAGNLEWLIRKDGCMHCDDPGCLKACPAPGAIVKYSNGIVDFMSENCIGCGYCVTGCPFNVPRISAKDNKAYKCTLCSDRVAVGLEPACVKTCPTGAIGFGTKEDMVAYGAWLPEGGAVQPAGRGRHARHVRAQACRPARPGGPAERPEHQPDGRAVEGHRQAARRGRHDRRGTGRILPLHQGRTARGQVRRVGVRSTAP
jgi:formate dehydrogenase iron-sulfur subunit